MAVIGGILRRCGGLWTYLTERVHARKEVELERERNSATAAVIQLLPPGADLFETEPNGRTRVIRLAPSASAAISLDRGEPPAGELSR
ncbi:hypothetical protein OG949_40340 (plasmid) [Streptomyces scopuliridis]|uniref:hypothetical protein n=1 Tax=Streptomyces scopuliridis TaxID=452529 RepID=UPI002DD95B44|nr:hypothetical protein [Streptomyces scopuliridis]WSB39009.1 hypothetical protein OG949_40340 [Streptomyces scopuliridis]